MGKHIDVARRIVRATPATIPAFLAGAALVASAAVAIADMENGSCTPGMSPGVSPPQSPGVSPPVSPGISPPVSPGVSPPQSPPMSPGLSPPMSPPECPPCPISPPQSPPQSPGVSPPVSPGVSPPQSPPMSPPVCPPMSPPMSPPANASPISVDDAYTTNEDTTLVIAAPGVLANDTDSEDDPMSAVLDQGPSEGYVTLHTDGSFTYSSTASFHGHDSFTYRAVDAQGVGNIARVSITITSVDDAPVGVQDSYVLQKKANLVVAAPGVLVNDTDVDTETLTAELVAAPAHGTLTFHADGSFVYDPAAQNPVDDSFTYRPFDGTSYGAPVTVTLNRSRGGRPR